MARRGKRRPYIESSSSDGEDPMAVDVAPPADDNVMPQREMRQSKRIALENRVWNAVAPASRAPRGTKSTASQDLEHDASVSPRKGRSGKGSDTVHVDKTGKGKAPKDDKHSAAPPFEASPSHDSDLYAAPDIDCNKSDSPEPDPLPEPSQTRSRAPSSSMASKRRSSSTLDLVVDAEIDEESSASGSSGDKNSETGGGINESDSESSDEDRGLKKLEKNPTQLARAFDFEEPMFVDQDDDEGIVEIPEDFRGYATPDRHSSARNTSSSRAVSYTSASLPPSSPLLSSPPIAKPAVKRSKALLSSDDEADAPPPKKSNKDTYGKGSSVDVRSQSRKGQNGHDGRDREQNRRDGRDREARGERNMSRSASQSRQRGKGKVDREPRGRRETDQRDKDRRDKDHRDKDRRDNDGRDKDRRDKDMRNKDERDKGHRDHHGSVRNKGDRARDTDVHEKRESSKGNTKQSSKTVGQTRRVDEEPKFRDIEDINSKKHRTASSKRTVEQKHTRAKPSVDQDDLESSAGGDSDDESIDLVYPAQGGKLGLLEQHRRVRHVTRGAMTRVTTDVCLKNAFPAEGLAKHNDLSRRALVKEAEARGDRQLARKIKNDDEYGMELAALVSQRIANLRNPVKRAADTVVATTFGLKQGDNAKGQWLQEGLRFIYPHDYENNTVNGEKPFDNCLFANLLQSLFFKRKNSQGSKVAHLFTSSLLDRPNEREIPAPMLALIATALFAAIHDYRSEVRSKVNDFNGEHYGAAYAEIIGTLNEIQNDGPEEYHFLMHNLYLDACGQTRTSRASDGPKVSFLKVKGMPRAA